MNSISASPLSPSSPPEVLGIRVRYDPKLLYISNSQGLWRFREIVVGPLFRAFPEREQQAILLHEAGHHKLRHLSGRIKRLWLLLWDHEKLMAYCAAQEFEADRFAAGCGYGPDLARALSRLETPKAPLHPPVSLRIAALTQSMV